MRPLISVITPTRNRHALLRQTMDSVTRQTFAAWEHIIVDDGSDDGTAEEVHRRAESDPRIRYIERSGSATGANVCRNLGVKAAAADFIVFLDSDDLLSPHCLARRLEIIERNADLDFVTFQTGVFIHRVGDHDRRPATDALGDDLLQFLFFECPWIITGPIWRKSSLERLGLFDEALLSWQDIELHVRAITSGLHYVRFSEIDHHVRWQFEETKVSVEQRRSMRHLNAAIDVIALLEAHVRRGPGMNWVRQRALCSLYYFVAERWIERGDLAPALAAWRLVRARAIGPAHLYRSGALLLLAQALTPTRRLAQRVSHKWQGWMRMRTNPELVAGQNPATDA